MTGLRRWAWMRSQSLYSFGPPTTIHVLVEDGTATICGLDVPRQAQPLHADAPRRWLDTRFASLDPDRDSDWAGVEDHRRNCRRCERVLIGKRICFSFDDHLTDEGTITAIEDNLLTIVLDETVELPDRLGGGWCVEVQREMSEVWWLAVTV